MTTTKVTFEIHWRDAGTEKWCAAAVFNTIEEARNQLEQMKRRTSVGVHDLGGGVAMRLKKELNIEYRLSMREQRRTIIEEVA